MARSPVNTPKGGFADPSDANANPPAPTIAETLAEETAPLSAPKLVPVMIKRDYWAGRDYKDQWPKNDEGAYIGISPDGSTCRIRAGTAMGLAKEEYLRLVKTGVVERNDPLPV